MSLAVDRVGGEVKSNDAESKGESDGVEKVGGEETNNPLSPTITCPEQAKEQASLTNPPPSIPDSTAAEQERDDKITANHIAEQLFVDHPDEKEEKEGDEDWCLINSSDAIEKEVGDGKGRMFGFC